MLFNRFLPYLIWFTVPAITGLWAISLGQDANWDLRNYHYYNPFSFLTERESFDVAVGQVASYYNPLMHIPFYYSVQTIPPIAVAFLLGALQGLNFPLLVLIARRVINLPEAKWTTYAALAIAVLGFNGAGFRSEVGTTFGDNIVSLFFLLGILLVINASDQHSCRPKYNFYIALAGLFVGAAVGLKQPSAIFAVGMCAAFLMRDMLWKHNIATAFLFGCGVLAGLATTGGFWMLELWRLYGNPLFPYFNQLFQSPWATIGEYRDMRFLPHGVVDAILFPFNTIFAPFRMGEVHFVDARVVLFYIGVLLLGVLTIWRRYTKKNSVNSNHHSANVRYLVATIIVTFLVWLKMFAIYRYLIGIELLLPLGIWLVLERIWRNARHVSIAFTIVVFVLLATTRAGSWGRVEFQSDYFGVTVPEIYQPQNTLILTAGFEPMSYLIPFFPASVRFFRVQSWFTGPTAKPNAFDKLMLDTVCQHQGDIYGLFKSYEQKTAESAFGSYGFSFNIEQCISMFPHIEDIDGKPTDQPFYFCKLEPMTTGATR